MAKLSKKAKKQRDDAELLDACVRVLAAYVGEKGYSEGVVDVLVRISEELNEKRVLVKSLSDRVVVMVDEKAALTTRIEEALKQRDQARMEEKSTQEVVSQQQVKIARLMREEGAARMQARVSDELARRLMANVLEWRPLP